MPDMNQLFTDDVCDNLFPANRADDFFEALFGDASEGSYDIALRYDGFDQEANTLHFLLNLSQRPGCCLACNLTYGLPQVFSRHPVINLNGVEKEINKLLGPDYETSGWQLKSTRSTSSELHQIPYVVSLS
ncbi:MAG: pancreas/duodenum homeobox protein 1 [Thermodesulfobacteriota bacterium]